MCWVAWKVILAEKEKGGLGVGSLSSLNLSLLAKWIWRFKRDPNTLWRNVINGLHNLGRKPLNKLAKKSLNGVWYNNLKMLNVLQDIGIDLSSAFKIRVGNGMNTLFWLDDWTGDGCFCERFPLLFQLDKHKSCLASERWRGGERGWDWKRKPSNTLEV